MKFFLSGAGVAALAPALAPTPSKENICMLSCCCSSYVAIDEREDCSGLGTPFFFVRYVTFLSVLKKECSVVFHSFLEFLATYETQKNIF